MAAVLERFLQLADIPYVLMSLERVGADFAAKILAQELTCWKQKFEVYIGLAMPKENEIGKVKLLFYLIGEQSRKL